MGRSLSKEFHTNPEAPIHLTPHADRCDVCDAKEISVCDAKKFETLLVRTDTLSIVHLYRSSFNHL